MFYTVWTCGGRLSAQDGQREKWMDLGSGMLVSPAQVLALEPYKSISKGHGLNSVQLSPNLAGVITPGSGVHNACRSEALDKNCPDMLLETAPDAHLLHIHRCK
jgi:hypothetical protein